MAGITNGVAELQAAIELKHFCKSVHQKTVFVHERMNAMETVWSGDVEVFDLVGHPEAQTCYAWRHKREEGVKIFTILGNHVVTSPHRAVQAAIFFGAQPPASRISAPVTKFSKDLQALNRRLRKTRKVLHETKIKIEDLDALIKAAAQLKEDIRQKRESSDSSDSKLGLAA